MTWSYSPKTDKQLKTWFDSKVREDKSGFKNYEDFRDWYDNKTKFCFYCGLTEEETQELIHRGLLTSKRFPNEGKTSQGVNRGYWLEVDRRIPTGVYSRENCELSCYFCNNDKSDVFTDIQYKVFVKDRIGFVRNLLKK